MDWKAALQRILGAITPRGVSLEALKDFVGLVSTMTPNDRRNYRFGIAAGLFTVSMILAALWGFFPSSVLWLAALRAWYLAYKLPKDETSNVIIPPASPKDGEAP